MTNKEIAGYLQNALAIGRMNHPAKKRKKDGLLIHPPEAGNFYEFAIERLIKKLGIR